MKKLILAFAIIGFITITAKNKTTSTITEKAIIVEKYKACIDACNKCIASCKKIDRICANKKGEKND